MAIVIGGFSVYEEFFASEPQGVSAMEHMDVSHKHGGGSSNMETSEVNTYVQSNADKIKIFLKDKTGNLVKNLEVNHEKPYLHVHPSNDQKPIFETEFK